MRQTKAVTAILAHRETAGGRRYLQHDGTPLSSTFRRLKELSGDRVKPISKAVATPEGGNLVNSSLGLRMSLSYATVLVGTLNVFATVLGSRESVHRLSQVPAGAGQRFAGDQDAGRGRSRARGGAADGGCGCAGRSAGATRGAGGSGAGRCAGASLSGISLIRLVGTLAAVTVTLGGAESKQHLSASP